MSWATPERRRAYGRAYREKNRVQRREYARRYAAENKERFLGYRLKRHFGITVEDYRAMFEKQGGVCAICGAPPPNKRGFHVDHDHKTGKIRGLLCHHCNVGIGNLRDSIDMLRKALAYLEARS